MTFSVDNVQVTNVVAEPSGLAVEATVTLPESTILIQVDQQEPVAAVLLPQEALIIQVEPQGVIGPPGTDGQAVFESGETDTAVVAGQPLYLKGNGHLDLAQADAIATSRVCGLSATAAVPTTSVDYCCDRVVLRPDWSAITGTPSLTPGAVYYLSPDVAGTMTTIAPTGAGQLVAVVGIALTPQKLEIEIQSTILL